LALRTWGIFVCLLAPAACLAADLGAEIERKTRRLESRVIETRRDLHQNPELSNRETRTAGVVAERLTSLGLEVRRGIAKTGVVGVLRGALPGPVVALRADMDALPVTEETGLPFASKVRTVYAGQEVGVMHACGHDAHTAILLGAAELLADLRSQLSGTVLFVFQPAEEGPPPGEEGGAPLMLKEGVFADPKPEAIFALHTDSELAAGEVAVVAGPAMASSDRLRIVVHGRGAHASAPWRGVDPIAIAARIVLELEALPAREVDVRKPSVVSISVIHAGVRYNVLPDEVELLGTVRALDAEVQKELHERIERTATKLAEAAGATATVELSERNPVTANDAALVKKMRPSLARTAKLVSALPRTGAEDFAWFAQEVPALYFWLGVRDPGTKLAAAAPNHSPRFLVDDGALAVGVRTLSQLVVDYAAIVAPPPPPPAPKPEPAKTQPKKAAPAKKPAAAKPAAKPKPAPAPAPAPAPKKK
jgi:amidohydrolase